VLPPSCRRQAALWLPSVEIDQAECCLRCAIVKGRDAGRPLIALAVFLPGLLEHERPGHAPISIRPRRHEWLGCPLIACHSRRAAAKLLAADDTQVPHSRTAELLEFNSQKNQQGTRKETKVHVRLNNLYSCKSELEAYKEGWNKDNTLQVHNQAWLEIIQAALLLHSLSLLAVHSIPELSITKLVCSCCHAQKNLTAIRQ
jgi:hypothetical protein